MDRSVFYALYESFLELLFSFTELLLEINLQGLFEGLKAYRKHDGNILLFRPNENGLRLRMGAERMCMPCPSVEQFVEAVNATVLANERWVM